MCVGHFNYPNDPIFSGEETFPGKIIHAHDFKNGADFKDMRVLSIGGSYSAEDVCLHCWRKGATFSHVSSRRPGGFGYTDWPERVEEKPILTNISGSTVTFADGTSEDYDAIIKCTGYVHKFTFLKDFEMSGKWVPSGLYKQCIDAVFCRFSGLM